MSVVGIVIGLLLLTAVAAGGALLWWRMRKGLPGVGLEEGRGSERDRDPQRGGAEIYTERKRERWGQIGMGERDSHGGAGRDR